MASSIFPLLLNAALQSALLRIYRNVYADILSSARPVDSQLRVYYDALEQTRKAIHELADFCRRSEIDATKHPLYASLELKTEFHDRFEEGRQLVLETITPETIFEVGEKGWIVKSMGWMIRRGSLVEMTDSYGQPAFAHPLILISPAGVRHTLDMPDTRRARAREAYSMITGQPSEADSLGEDPDHLFDLIA
ncbi:hypothetical protein IIE18_10605 [Pseudomonas sp. V1]|uniref:hypothetical protein n=1 Tax=Pseudomonas arcuscaelestis TaxID=2710591 RepID=UPI00193F4C05|nr:hypothetical protein [Pseudomonas arcuscaelestis]MBM3105590.1 hypothetical protein [Pseudomonas arcuscaelestis]